MPDFLGNELYHHGIKGQRWGIRRFQREDGSLTPAGRRHWGVGPPEKGSAEAARSGKNSGSEPNKSEARIAKSVEKNSGVSGNQKSSSTDSEKKSTTTYTPEKARAVTNDAKKALDKDTLKKALMIGGGVAIAGLAAYGAYKYVGNKNLPMVLDSASLVSADVVGEPSSVFAKSMKFDATSYRNAYASALVGLQTSKNATDQIAAIRNLPTYVGSPTSKETSYDLDFDTVTSGFTLSERDRPGDVPLLTLSEHIMDPNQIDGYYAQTVAEWDNVSAGSALARGKYQVELGKREIAKLLNRSIG